VDDEQSLTADGRIESDERRWQGLRSLIVAQFFGAFNDNAWKQLVILLAINGAVSESEGQIQTALAQIVLLTPFLVFSLPAGVLADRVSKRSVIVAMKLVEVVLMLAGTAAFLIQPGGGLLPFCVLGLLGIQATLFSPAKYGILPELLSHEQLSAGNGHLELWTNLANLSGIVGGGAILWGAQKIGGGPWPGGLLLAVFSVFGLLSALRIPSVPAARSEGGLATTIRIAAESIRSDRVLQLALLGQIFVWSIAMIVPAAILPYAKQQLHLPDWETGLPLGALGIGIGAGCLLAGKLSASKVEYGLLPLGAIGLTGSALLFAVIGPGLVGTLFLMGLLGTSAGLVFVPLNAILQWRSPADRRGAVISVANVLTNAGMILGSGVALFLATRDVSPRGTFLVASLVLAAGTAGALALVPDAFLRFILIGLANTLYRVRIIGRSNVPAEGGALLVPNHVSFADGLFLLASTDRPIRFVVYAAYFEKPIRGWLLRAMKAIPIMSSGGPKMILHAFREAGRALDQGELVCVFPEGQLTRTGMMAPFQRGLQRIVKGHVTPIIPVHLDRLEGSIFSPISRRRLPRRIPYPMTVSFGKPLPPEAPLYQIRHAIRELDEAAWTLRKDDRMPLHHGFIRQARRHPFRLVFADLQQPFVGNMRALAGAIAIARVLRERWKSEPNAGILLPASVGSALVNLAATMAGKAVVNLNFTSGRAGMESAAKQAGLKAVVTSRAFVEKAKLDLPDGLDLVYLEDVIATLRRLDRLVAMLLAIAAPIRVLERAAGAASRPTIDDTAAIIFSSGSTGDPKGVVLSHFNIDSNIEAIALVYRVEPNDRLIGILPPFHSFGYTIFWFAANYGIGTVFHPNPLDAALIGTLVERYCATILLATPTFLQLYLRRCAPAQFGSLRLILVGAEKLPESLATTFEDTFGIRPLEGYGLTECAPVVAVNTFDWREPGFFQPGSRRGSVGQPLPGVLVQIVSPETFEPLAPEMEGMVLVKGPNVMRGYLGRDDLTRSAFCDGWYITGDLGHLTEDGFLTISGRLSRFSKIGGEMVPHGQVEQALHEAIGATNQVFAVTAVSHARKGEMLAVLHTLDDAQVEKAIDGLAARGFPNLFIPRRDHFIKVDAIPVLGTGKLDLRAMHRLAEEALAHREAEITTTRKDAEALCQN
jgi:acyl-[acyl-carrier-protein]-phospholipid O-acyltransferase/long-chain-fatty-acid--[acyl-carrier-protein] ligase